MEELCLLAGSAFFLIQLKTTVAPTIVGWALRHQSLLKEMLPSLAYRLGGQRHGRIEIPSSQMTLTCVELTKKLVQKPTQMS